MKRTNKILFILFALSISCTDFPQVKNECIKGKFLGSYCSGYIIQILDNSNIGKTWKSELHGIEYKNCLVANLDTAVFKISTHKDALNASLDSIIYFKFKEGGYPRQNFNICEPVPFVTITYTSPTPCPPNEVE
jgi:hypothetical protein